MEKKEPISMILFCKEDLLGILKTLKVEVSEERVIDPKTKKQAKCVSCQTRLFVDNLGHIAKRNPIDFYCTNPSCFTHFVAIRKLWGD